MDAQQLREQQDPRSQATAQIWKEIPQNEIDESVAELMFEEVRSPTQADRHAVGWNHLPKWSQASSSTRAVMNNQERRRKVEQDRVARGVQQSQQGKWTTWEDVYATEALPAFWNDLLLLIRSQPTMELFSCQLKIHLFRIAIDWEPRQL